LLRILEEDSGEIDTAQNSLPQLFGIDRAKFDFGGPKLDHVLDQGPTYETHEAETARHESEGNVTAAVAESTRTNEASENEHSSESVAAKDDISVDALASGPVDAHTFADPVRTHETTAEESLSDVLRSSEITHAFPASVQTKMSATAESKVDELEEELDDLLLGGSSQTDNNEQSQRK